jgi:methionine sulfoxide reductase heme-binding subunit
VLLILSLACTPLNLIFGWSWVFPIRRLLGLYAFLYAAIHLLIFVGLDYGFQMDLVVEADARPMNIPRWDWLPF